MSYRWHNGWQQPDMDIPPPEPSGHSRYLPKNELIIQAFEEVTDFFVCLHTLEDLVLPSQGCS